MLDEPLSNLDSHLRDQMRGLIRQVQRDTGVTTMMVTHDPDQARRANRHIQIVDGQLNDATLYEPLGYEPLVAAGA